MKPPGGISVVVLTIIVLGCTFALAEPYEVAYVAPQCEACAAAEGLPGPFPEDQGWTRISRFGTVLRSIQDGAMALEAFENFDWEYYPKDMNDTLDPAPGEFLYVEWQMVVDDENIPADTGVLLALDNFGGVVGVGIAIDRVEDAEGREEYLFEPGVFHTFLLVTIDLDAYDLFVDGNFAFSDFFKRPTILNSRVSFGDGSTSYSSSRWKYVRFGAAELGDLDRNGRVNLLDFATFARCFGVTVDNPAGACSDQEAMLSDLDGDGAVTLNDFATLAVNFEG